jgi:hypothetical protein
MKRSHRNEELLEALLEIMEAEKVITKKEKQLIKNSRQRGERVELANGLVKRRK